MSNSKAWISSKSGAVIEQRQQIIYATNSPQPRGRHHKNVVQIFPRHIKMRPILVICGILLLNSCTDFQNHRVTNPRYTPVEARNYVNWWAENVRPSQRSVFQAALLGDHNALRRILNDTDNSFGPPDQEGYPSSVLAGAFLLAIGDEAFAEFIRTESLDVQCRVFGSLNYGPWSLTYSATTVSAVTESDFSRLFPRTAKIRNQFYADYSKRAQQVVDGKLPEAPQPPR